MSWMSKKTGRPKEQGGHRTFHVSVNNRISNILRIPGNRSECIENCVNATVKTEWMAFHESDVTANDNYSVFKTAATGVWLPNCVPNGVVATLCTFEHRCTGRGLLFRMKVNDSLTSPVEVPGTTTWSSSEVFTESSFVGGIRVQPNQDSYVVEYQFEPFGILGRASVRDISMFLEVVDGMSDSEI
jgi:hypothetical protein